MEPARNLSLPRTASTGEKIPLSGKLERPALPLPEDKFRNSEGVGLNGQGRVESSDGRKAASVYDEKIVHVVGLAILVQDGAPGVFSHPTAPHLVLAEPAALIAFDRASEILACERFRQQLFDGASGAKDLNASVGQEKRRLNVEGVDTVCGSDDG